MPETRAVRSRASSVAVLVISAVALSACTALPTDGKLHVSSLVANSNQNAVQVSSKSWDQNMSPEDVVRNFQQAMAGDDGDPTFATAQTYLTGDASHAYKAWAGETHVYDRVQTNLSSGATTPAPGSKTVTVLASGSLLATVDSFGFYHAEDPADESQTYTLTRVPGGAGGGGWKITTAPQYRLIALADFRRTTPAPLPVYEIPSGGDGRVMQRIDQVYVLKSAGNPDYTYQQLADALLAGQNLRATVTLDPNGGNVTATLTGALPAGWDYPRVAEAMAKTFDAASAPQAVPSPVPQFSSLTLLCGSRPVSGPAPLCPGTTTANVRSQSELPPAPAVYFASGDQVVSATPGAKSAQQVAAVLGEGRAFDALAVKNVAGAEPDGTRPGSGPPVAGTTVVAVDVTAGRDKGWVVVATDGDPKTATVKKWYEPKGTVTSLDWDPADGSLWVVDDGQLYDVRPGADGTVTAVGPLPVLAKATDGQSLLRFKVSPDGREAAVVTTATTDLVTKAALAQAWMVPLDRRGPVPAPQEGAYPLLADLKSVKDVAWAGRRALVLLGTDKAASDAKLYQVYADGSQDATLEGATADAQSSAAHIAAQGVEAGTPQFRVFSDGAVAATAAGDAARTAVYWKGQTFDPVVAPPATGPQKSQALPTLATYALK